ncbi:alpha/beta hydrolase [Sandaracinobacteroides saxicola]|uniref:Alpha/beta hydrolase n=1 Tax=Sandaracinobacteroides saxicola TaxID=2759707 RepID=A0A7G5IED9_9SPHN|nr:alpha/beta hydrolase [Sandaracinobacteroides saxicola]QMW21731.1 alpha/beta hydrolase [Sandaracinobacteroides saxicola]
MADIILVHGAWHGGWCWRDVAADLRGRGHRVLVPTLTGMGERVHLLSAETGVVQHAADIMAVAEAEEVREATLAVHSYGGMPGALATAHPAIARLVLVDAVPAVPGQSLLSGAPAEAVEAARARLVSGGLALPPLDPTEFDVPADHPGYPWVKRRLTPLPWRCLADELPALPDRHAAVPKTYVEAAGNSLDGPRRGLAQARAAGWPVVTIDSGHDLPVTAPAELAAVIDRLSR